MTDAQLERLISLTQDNLKRAHAQGNKNSVLLYMDDLRRLKEMRSPERIAELERLMGVA